MQVPEEYKGREQSFLKHRVLHEYVLAWGHKVASLGRRRKLRLCYVDGFAGPWKSQSKELEDTSIAIGLRALEAAATTWRLQGAQIEIEAMFVEKDATAFGELDRFLKERGGGVPAVARHGEFGALVPEVLRWLGSDAALVFVDPTGWKGAAMHFIAPLLGVPRRDVLVNVMFDYINRFKDDPRDFLREQMRDFFGLGDADMPEGLGEEQLFALYRAKLKELCRVKYAADLAIPHPTDDRTKFRLVVGGSDPAVLELFRKIEQKVIGEEAAAVRDEASTHRDEDRTGQLRLLVAPPASDIRYESLHGLGLRDASRDLLSALAHIGAATFRDVWPSLLETHHITKVELARLVWELRKRGEITVANLKARERTMRDDHIMRLKA